MIVTVVVGAAAALAACGSAAAPAYPPATGGYLAHSPDGHAVAYIDVTSSGASLSGSIQAAGRRTSGTWGTTEPFSAEVTGRSIAFHFPRGFLALSNASGRSAAGDVVIDAFPWPSGAVSADFAPSTPQALSLALLALTSGP